METAPQMRFDRAVYDGAPTSLLYCAFCGRGIDVLRFEIAGRSACEVCTQRIKALLPADSWRVFARACGFGLLAAVASGLALLGIMQIFPDVPAVGGELFAAWGVGWSIARAIRAGSNGALGRKYQIAGSLFAYAAMVYPMQGYIMGFHEEAWWTYPFVLLRPIAFLFTDARPVGSLELLAASIAMTWTWRGLRGSPNPIRAV